MNSRTRKIAVVVLLLLTITLAGLSVFIALRLRERQEPDEGEAATGQGFTNCCGSGFSCTGGSTCGRGCSGTSCSGSYVFRYVCDGRQTECRSNESGPSTNASALDSCGKTVQVDVFNKNCRAGGGWSCGAGDLLDYIVYYNGDCDNPPPPPPPPPPPVCDFDGVIDAGEQCDGAANPTGCPTGSYCSDDCTCKTVPRFDCSQISVNVRGLTQGASGNLVYSGGNASVFCTLQSSQQNPGSWRAGVANGFQSASSFSSNLVRREPWWSIGGVDAKPPTGSTQYTVGCFEVVGGGNETPTATASCIKLVEVQQQQTTCYRCTERLDDENICESQTITGTDCSTLGSGWSSNSNCAQEAGGSCPALPECGEPCLNGTTCAIGQACENNVCVLQQCVGAGTNCSEDKCTYTPPPRITCYRCTDALTDGNQCLLTTFDGTTCPSGWTSNSNCYQDLPNGVCPTTQQTTCYRCTAVTNDGNTCETQSISGTDCTTLGAGWTNNSSCQTAAPGGVCAVQTTCYRCTPDQTDVPTGNLACESQVVTGATCPTGWSTNSNCAQEAGGACPYTQPTCGQQCPFGICSTGNTCVAGVCVDNTCNSNPELCETDMCTPNNPICGEECQEGFADCGTGYTCNNGTCELDACVSSPSSCQPGMCELQDDLCGDPCDPNGPNTCPQGHTCNPNTGDPDNGTCALDTCLTTPEVCNPDLCTYNEPVCGEACIPGVVPCTGTGEVCDPDTNTCILEICTRQNCGSDQCTPPEPPETVCGDPCTSTSQCPNGHVCSNGTCKLSQCVTGTATCNTSGCAILPNTSVSVEDNTYLLIGMVLLLTSLVAYKLQLGAIVVNKLNIKLNRHSKTRFQSERHKFEKKISRNKK